MICKNCKYEHFEGHNGRPNRYYCIHKEAAKVVNAGARMISRTERNSNHRNHKAAPRWCPLKEKSYVDPEILFGGLPTD